MPKDIFNPKYIAEPITADKKVISLKLKTQPLAKEEKNKLNEIYTDAVACLEKTVHSIQQLELFLSEYDETDKAKKGNLRDFFDPKVHEDLSHTLKMVKRHFYINISHNSINEFLSALQEIKNNVLKTSKGLAGKLNISVKKLNNEPTAEEISQFDDKTYTLVIKNGERSFAYYENKIKKFDIPLADIDPNLATMPTSKLNTLFLLRKVIHFHATTFENDTTDQVFISNISKKNQDMPNNTEVGYVFRKQLGPWHEFFGPIHIDYRLLKQNPAEAFNTLLHEASHRYAWVDDHGYYSKIKTKALKNGGSRPYPATIQNDFSKAVDNADTYAYFVLDVTKSNELYKKNNLFSQQIKKFSLFALSAAVVGGGLYYAASNYNMGFRYNK